MKRFHVYWVAGRVSPGYVVYDQERFTPSNKPVMIVCGAATLADALHAIEDYLVGQIFEVIPVAGTLNACIRYLPSGALLHGGFTGSGSPYICSLDGAASLVRAFVRNPSRLPGEMIGQ